MSKKNDKYPNKADYEPNIDKNAVDNGELPLSYLSESNETEVFRQNEAKTDDVLEKSAFGQNKKEK